MLCTSLVIEPSETLKVSVVPSVTVPLTPGTSSKPPLERSRAGGACVAGNRGREGSGREVRGVLRDQVGDVARIDEELFHLGIEGHPAGIREVDVDPDVEFAAGARSTPLDRVRAVLARQRDRLRRDPPEGGLCRDAQLVEHRDGEVGVRLTGPGVVRERVGRAVVVAEAVGHRGGDVVHDRGDNLLLGRLTDGQALHFGQRGCRKRGARRRRQPVRGITAQGGDREGGGAAEFAQPDVIVACTCSVTWMSVLAGGLFQVTRWIGAPLITRSCGLLA